MENLKKTALHDWHVTHGGNICPFGQYAMPLWYSAGVKAEHLAVIQTAGLFDTSHMAAVTVEGDGARTLLQYCFSKDLDQCIGPKKKELTAGRCVYGVFLQDDGTVVDDAIVSQLSDDRYLVVVNAGMGGEIAARLTEHNADHSASIVDLTDKIGKMDIQGPAALKIMLPLLENGENVLADLIYFSFKGGFCGIQGTTPVRLKSGIDILLSRTGYTGEFGFEIFTAKDDLVPVWQEVLAAGEDFGLLPCGLAARDSLRAGAVLPLSHQDIGPWVFTGNPWQFALPWNAEQSGFSKTFIGDSAIQQDSVVQFTIPFAGFDPRKIVISDTACVTDLSGKKIGKILTCATDMAIGRVAGRIYSIASAVSAGRPEAFSPRGLCCGFVLLNEKLPPGTEVLLSDGGKKSIKVEIRDDVRPDRTARRPIREMI